VVESGGKQIITKFNEHNHMSDALLQPLAQFHSTVKMTALDSTQLGCKIVKSLKAAASPSVVLFLPSERSLHQKTERNRLTNRKVKQLIL
jgi:hypothetical protein